MFSSSRTTPRFNLKIPIRIRRLDEMGSPEHTVVSSNVSAGGVYFASDLQLKLGTPVRVYFRIPEQIAGKHVPRWCCEGRVIHVHSSGRSGKELGIGISFQVYSLLTDARLEATGERLPMRASNLGPR
jgi:PilZ domain